MPRKAAGRRTEFEPHPDLARVVLAPSRTERYLPRRTRAIKPEREAALPASAESIGGPLVAPSLSGDCALDRSNERQAVRLPVRPTAISSS